MKKRNYFIAMALGFTIIIGGCGSTASRQTPPVTTNQESSQTDTAQNTIPTETVIQSTQPADTATQNLQPADTSTQISDSFVQNAQSSSHDNGNTSTASSIGEVQALEIALNHAGVKSSDLAFSYAHGDFDDGRSVYDVEFVVGNTEYDYEIDATTGNILDFDYDMESQYAPNANPGSGKGNGNANAATISIDMAKQTALSRVPGATVNDITKMKTDYDDGRMEYEGTIVYNGMEYDFTIDATTGQITDWDVESLYD